MQFGAEHLGKTLELAPHVAGQAFEGHFQGLVHGWACEDASPVEPEDVAEEVSSGRPFPFSSF